MDTLLTGLRAAGEPTRLRLLALCAHGELTVTELTQILGQSQPRVSRHLKLLCDGGFLDRIREGSWVFYRLSDDGACAHLGRTLVDLIPEGDPVQALDLKRLETVKRVRAERAASYFRANAARWNEIRSLYVSETDVEKALLAMVGDDLVEDYLDIGTGSGRLLELLAPMVRRGTGIDLSKEMLSVARANLESAALRHCQVRHGDMYNLSLPNDSADLVTLHQVLHYADNPPAAIAEACRVLKPGGRLIVVDFAPHELEFLREEHAHRRLGFADDDIAEWCRQAGLELADVRHLEGDPLTVSIWPAQKSAATETGEWLQ